MRLDALVYPRCGGELDGVGQDDTVRRPYCGAMLHIERSPESVQVRVTELKEDGKTKRVKIKFETEKLKNQQRRTRNDCPFT